MSNPCGRSRGRVLHMRFGIIGGDERQVYLAKSIAKDGYSVYISCLEQAKEAAELRRLPIKELTERCGILILPLPVTKDGVHLNAPYSTVRVPLGEEFAAMVRGKQVYGGLLNRVDKIEEKWKDVSWFDYYSREELVLGNAVLTAEGAAGMAICELPGALCGASCLVTGFGRIGKALCRLLRGLCADVDCAARKSKDFMEIHGMGCTPVAYGEIAKCYDVIFNTVPHQVLTAAQLAKQSRDTVILELASPPGGVDLEAAGRLRIRVLDGASIPGRFSPKTAGEYMKETIYNMMEES